MKNESNTAFRCDAWLAVGFCFLFVVSCARRPLHVEPPLSLPAAFSGTGASALHEQWWTAFEDPQLDALVARALEDNFTLRTAWDRLDQAQATAKKSGAGLWPSLDGSAGVSRTVSKVGGFDRMYSTDYVLGLAARYEVDLWGRVRAERDSAGLNTAAAWEDLHAAAITLTAEVARTWYQVIEQRGQLNILDEQLETNGKYLDLITLKFRRGQVSATDVLQQRQLVESTKGERVIVQSNLKVLEHQLAILLGVPPDALDVHPGSELPALPPMPDAGLPAEWIRRRPDIRAAEARIQAADRRVAAAVAARFPALRLTADADTSAEEIRDLFDNWLASIAANLTAPLFDAGERRAEVERTRAALSEQLNSYGQLVLQSVKEVEDALVRETRQSEYVASLGEQLKLSRQSTEQTLENYTKGTMDFTRYLTTLLSHQRLQRTYLQARRELVLHRIGLYRALAGSWSLTRPPHVRPAETRVSGQSSRGEEPKSSLPSSIV